MPELREFARVAASGGSECDQHRLDAKIYAPKSSQHVHAKLFHAPMPKPQDDISCDNGAGFLAGKAHIWLSPELLNAAQEVTLARVGLIPRARQHRLPNPLVGVSTPINQHRTKIGICVATCIPSWSWNRIA
jgi:hypothetical protein